jgi:hypothetical protein
MNNFLFQVLFGCAHRKTTFPQTPVRRARNVAAQTESKGQTYIACLNCGKELPYDWERMRRVRSSRLANPVLALRQVKAGFRLRSAS